METLKQKLYLTSSAVAIGLAISYLYYKKRRRIRDAKDVFNYLKINIVTDEKSCDEVIALLRKKCQKHQALGFDCEWVTEKGHRHPVALVQLSSNDGECGLFRLNFFDHLPLSLKNLLEDERIYKVGVAPGNDAKYLLSDYFCHLKSSLDVRHLAEECGYETGGLAALSRQLLGAEMDKSWRVRCGDWEAPELTEGQISYAAIDAHAAIKIFALLLEEQHRKKTGWFEKTEELCAEDYCLKYADVNFKTKQTVKVKRESDKTKSSKVLLVPSKRYPHAFRSKPLYHNCFLQAPDGELLCTCDNKKALWYVDKGLADLVQDEPMIVKLRFEPAGRSVGDVGKYYQLKKENKCVVCGSTNSYIRKNVVPREYRKYFPEIMKDHSSHDVVLLCASCHQASNMRDQLVRERLASECDAPLAKQQMSRYTEDALSKRIKSAANALLYQSRKHVLPDERRKELEDIILQHYPDHNEITEELLQEALQIQVLHENSDYEIHGLKVVEYYLDRDGLLRLEEIWREHFLSCMRPKYLPELWSVKHNEERLRIKWKEGRLSVEDLKSIGLTRL